MNVDELEKILEFIQEGQNDRVCLPADLKMMLALLQADEKKYMDMSFKVWNAYYSAYCGVKELIHAVEGDFDEKIL